MEKQWYEFLKGMHWLFKSDSPVKHPEPYLGGKKRR